MLTAIIVVVIIYFIAMAGIGWMGRKYAKTFDSYLNMGRSAGILMIMGAAIGGHIGNGFVIGGAGEGAAVGLSGAAYGLACAATNIIIAVFLAKFIYKGGYISMAEFTHKRYNNDVPGLIYDIAGAISCTGAMAAQIMAGKALFSSLGLNPTIGVIALCLVILVYSQLAGIWGAYATSVVQVAIIIVGLVATTAVLFSQGAVGTIQDAIATGEVPETFDNVVGGYSSAVLIGMTLPVMFQVVTDQTVFQRINSGKSYKTVQWAHIISIIVMIPLALMPAFIGAYGRIAYGINSSDVFFVVVMNNLPMLAAAIVVAATLAAVMSTVDGGLIAINAYVTHDIYQTLMKKNPSEEKLKKITLGLNLAVMIVSLVCALSFNNIINLLNMTYGFLAASCFVPFVFGAVWKKGTAQGAVASSVVGIALVVAGWFGLSLPLPDVFPVLPAAIVYVVVSLCTQNKSAEAAH